MSIPVRLEVDDGGLVKEMFLPASKRLPDVLIWGDRIFKFHGGSPKLIVYREAYVYVVPPLEVA